MIKDFLTDSSDKFLIKDKILSYHSKSKIYTKKIFHSRDLATRKSAENQFIEKQVRLLAGLLAELEG
jgi:hypothetical protein